MTPAQPTVENKYQRARELSGCAQDAPAAAATAVPAAPVLRREPLRLCCVDRERVIPIPTRLEALLPSGFRSRRSFCSAISVPRSAGMPPVS